MRTITRDANACCRDDADADITAAAQRRSRSAHNSHVYRGEKYNWATNFRESNFFLRFQSIAFLIEIFSTILFFVLLSLI